MKDRKELESIMLAIVQRFTDKKPGAVSVELRETLRAFNITYQCEPRFVGRIIGPSGEMVDSLQVIANKMAGNIGKAVVVEVEKTQKRETDYHPFILDKNYKPTPDAKLLERIGHFAWNDGADVGIEDISDTTTKLTLFVDGEEDNDMRLSLCTVFNAIGRANGRKLLVDVQTNTVKS